MNQTLDQKRAAYAWSAVVAVRKAEAEFGAYRKLAKGAPAMVMGNGLMAALAFYQSRDKGPGKQLVKDLLGWLAMRGGAADFLAAMTGMQTMDSTAYMALTEESMAVLRWIRQFTDALKPQLPAARA